LHRLHGYNAETKGVRLRSMPRPNGDAKPLDLDLAGAKTAGELYDRIAQAMDQGKVAVSARDLIELLKARSVVVAAEEFRKRLELTEAIARDAQRRALPPGRATVEVASEGK